MNCRIELTARSDRPYWVKWLDFKRCLVEEDFACRESTIIQPCYLWAWFSKHDGERFFNPPAFCLEGGWARLINGCHRTALLVKYLDVLPMALTRIDRESEAVLHGIVLREIGLDEVIALPDLPIEHTVASGTGRDQN
jgi:hypothetical protein